MPDAVVIDEAVELAKQLSTDDSPAFVNGVLARVLAGAARRPVPPPGAHPRPPTTPGLDGMT